MRQVQESKEKKLYQTPSLDVHGDVASITRALGTGNYLDAQFPMGTHKDDLGWSP